MPLNPRARLTTEQAAQYLNVSVSTLKRWRRRNEGPQVIRLEPSRMVRYEVWALDRFIDNRRKAK